MAQQQQQQQQQAGVGADFTFYWRHQWREWRHNPCIMTPLCVVMILIMAACGVAVFLIKFPTLILALLLQPLANRFSWVIEFLYPTALGRSIHFFMLRLSGRSRKARPNDKNYGYHSRTIESRVEVVKGRVYVHPLPQLMDNLGYLVVCCPERRGGGAETPRTDGPYIRGQPPAPVDKITVHRTAADQRIVAFCVDVGDAQAVARQIKLISKVHYDKQKIYVQSILATHKHHDHTAGIRELFQHEEYGEHIKLVMGGAVEKVPMCNFSLANGDPIPLPKEGRNDMQNVVEVEAIATPGHTRGSLSYALRPKKDAALFSSVSAILFTGDTMFSAGGGVPFEADVDPDQDKLGKVSANSYIKASAAKNAIERCFSELLFRSVPSMKEMQQLTSDRILVFPGHEYTHDLLNRQLVQPTENCRWKNFSPNVFFEMVSHFYVSLHRRSLPFSSGRLLVVPTPISREISINPSLRSLKKRGEIVVSAIRLWNHHFAKVHTSNDVRGAFGLSGRVDGYNSAAADDERSSSSSSSSSGGYYPTKTASTDKRWTLDSRDISAPVFTTVYAADLDQVIDDLENCKIDTQSAAQQLREIKDMLNLPVVGRRPIPGSLPSERVVYKGLVGFALLGSTPCALTLSDSEAMKLPAPIVDSSDLILVSKAKLISVLYWLGLLTEDNEGQRLVAIIEQVWNEAREYETKLKAFPVRESAQQNGETGYDTVDVEASSSSSTGDLVELGSLKWIVYGIPSQRPSCFPKFCMPCAKQPADADGGTSLEDHPIHKSNMKRESGELVRHDVLECLICKGAAGCPEGSSEEQYEVGSASFLSSAEDEGEDGIEIDRNALGSILRDV